MQTLDPGTYLHRFHPTNLWCEPWQLPSFLGIFRHLRVLWRVRENGLIICSPKPDLSLAVPAENYRNTVNAEGYQNSSHPFSVEAEVALNVQNESKWFDIPLLWEIKLLGCGRYVLAHVVFGAWPTAEIAEASCCAEEAWCAAEALLPRCHTTGQCCVLCSLHSASISGRGRVGGRFLLSATPLYHYTYYSDGPVQRCSIRW